jgi:tetratricopeptide (TPR) repeat protein
MSPLCPASSRSRPTALVLIVLFSVTGVARADDAKLLVFAPQLPRDAARWQARLSRAYGALDVDPELWLRHADPQRGIDPERLAALARIEGQLVHAAERAAALAEEEALTALAQAADLGEQLADMPGAAAWNAEIQLRLAVIAAQAGQDGLAESAFRYAATLDPTRRLLDAEAAPEIVARATRVQRESALGARGEIEVRVPVDGARVFLDDVAQGSAPARVRAPVGRHLLRVEAPGRVTYGAFIDVLEGARPAIVVEPAASPELERVRALAQAAQRGQYARVAEALAHDVSLGGVLVLETAPGSARALLVACVADGCRRALRIASAAVPGALPDMRLDAGELVRDRAWLAPSPVAARDEATPWWRRWYVLAPLVAVAAGATATALALSSGESTPPQRLRVVVDLGAVGH